MEAVMVPQRTIESIGVNFFDPAVIARPHPFYRRLREESPIIWSDMMQAWVLTHYEPVRSVLRDSGERFTAVRDPRGAASRIKHHVEQVAPMGTLTMLGADPPDHTRLRRLLDRDFTPGKISQMTTHVEEVANRLVAGAASQGEFDVVDGLAVPLPVTVIAELLGIPPELGAQFKKWSDAATEPIHPEATKEEVDHRNVLIVEFRDYLAQAIESRRSKPTDDFIGRLVSAHDDEAKLTDAELLAAVNLLLLAGNETTTNLISNAVLALHQFPDQQRLLRAEPARMEDAVEEFLRYDGSVQYTSRRAVQDTEFHGQHVKAGENLIIVLASANRDEREFPNSEALDISRERKRHVGFGDWIHICLGQHLARLETRAAISALLKEFPSYRITTPVDEIPYRANFNLRGPLHLPIALAGG